MLQSHGSYSSCGLGSEGICILIQMLCYDTSIIGTDIIVDLTKQAGKESGMYGAKITGGGSGGTVCVIGRATADTSVCELVDKYTQSTGHTPYLFSGSSPGAMEFGHMCVKFD